jgi:hypothetical protein
MTPVHSAHETRPCSSCTVPAIGVFENSGPLLPPHSIKAIRETIG